MHGCIGIFLVDISLRSSMSIPRRLADLSEGEQFESVYSWVDSIPLSRPKRNISRDFSDAAMLAELIRHFRPNMVEAHNYAASGSVSQKLHNWSTLNMKVFRRLGFQVNDKDMEECAQAKPGAIEKVLAKVKSCLERGPHSVLVPSRPASATRPRVTEPVPPELPSLSPSPDQEKTISELRRSNAILVEKNSKLEQLLEVKNKKIDALQQRLSS